MNFLAILAPLREKNTNKLSPRRKVRKGVRGKNKQEHEVLCDLCASAREKTNKSRQGAKHAKVYGLKTSQALEVLGGPGDLAKVNP